MKLPAVVKICTCEQCKYVKNKRKNRKTKARIARYLKRAAKNKPGEIIYFYWA